MTRYPRRPSAPCLLALLLTVMGMTLLQARRLPAQSAAPTLAEADRLYAEKSYAGALQAYEALLKGGQVPVGRADEVRYRVVVSVGKTQKWDRALQETLDYIKARRGTIWEARGLYWYGRLFLGVPHDGWKVGAKVYRGASAPQLPGSEKPEQVYLQDLDFQNARDALEAARVFYPRFRKEHDTEAEEIQLNYDLQRALRLYPEMQTWARALKWPPPADPTWKFDLAKPYDPSWAPPKKQLFLMDQIGMLARSKEGPRAHHAAVALFARAQWLQNYHQMMQQVSWRYEKGQRIRIPYPYQDEKPETFYRQLVRDFPEDPIRDQSQYALGVYLEGRGAVVEAVAEYRRLADEMPRSKWADDARAQLEEITLRRLHLSVPTPVPAGQAVKGSLQTRNVKEVQLELFRLKLEEGLTRLDVLEDPRRAFQGFDGTLGKLDEVRKYLGPLVSRWTVTVNDTGKHEYLQSTFDLPTKDVGAYLVIASTPGVRMAQVVLLTDLLAVQKLDRDHSVTFVTNGATGEPVSGADVVVKQWWREGNSDRTSFRRGKTGPEGIFTSPLDRAAGRSGFRTVAFAWKQARYALTSQLANWWSEGNRSYIKGLCVTDRAAYRPAQTVFYRQVLYRRSGGEYKPAANLSTLVTVRDPRGQAIHEARATTNEFGSVNGSFSISSDAPLGVYSLDARMGASPNEGVANAGNQFRVEEYKKPEFEVTVKPAATRVRLGEPTSATIQASYYFGGPVPGAKVTYRIHRAPHRQYHRFPRPFDFLYPWYSAGYYDTNYRNSPVVKQGETKTDALGTAEISFATEVDKNSPEQDYSYTIEADVQDASRRTISGDGSVKATVHDVAAFLDFRRGYATQGDVVDVEIRTLNPSDQPVSVAGGARVYRYPDTPDKKQEVVHEEALKTDAQGRAMLHWKSDQSGHFRVAFETRDSANLPVVGSVDLWVNGPDLERGRVLFRDVLLRSKELYYEEGQTASVLLVTPDAGCSVMLTREVADQIMERRLIRVEGRSTELKIPITAADVPNVYLTVTMVRDHRVFAANLELFVPPVNQFTEVVVKTDRDRYEPGEKGKVKLTARDSRGRPVRGDFSVAVTDASLDYIQKSYAPEIRAYFYGERRGLSVQTSTSTGTQIGSITEDTQPRKRYERRGFELPDGMGQIPDWPGEQAGGYWLRRDMFFGDSYFGGGGGFGGGFRGADRLEGRAAAAGLGGFSQQGLAGPAGPAGGRQRRNALADEKEMAGKSESGGGGSDGPTRTNFADTAFWVPSVVTDARGEATVEVTWPDNLTRWEVGAVGGSLTAQVGSGETTATTRKELLVRLQAPRFFVERDLVALSANVHNYTDAPQKARVRLALGEDYAEIVRDRGPVALLTREQKADGDSVFATGPEVTIDLPKQGERRVDWMIRVVREGSLTVRMSAQTSARQDATQLKIPVLVHGVEKQVAKSGVLRGERREEAQLAISLPRDRKPGSSELVVQLNPSLAATMLDALPYLVDYPYGCIEQTMSRFLPTVVVAKTLKDLGYNLEDLAQRARALEEKARQGDAAQPGGNRAANSPYTYPRGRPGTLRVRELASHTRRSRSPVFDSTEMKGMVTEGLARITRAQGPDGGWGWWPGNSSDPYMTAYVLYGLQTARAAEVDVDQGMLDRGLDYLRGRFLVESNVHMLAYEARVLAMAPRMHNTIRPIVTGRLYDLRERLTPYSKALLAMSLHTLGDTEKSQVLLRNVETTAHLDEGNGTANWDRSRQGWWYWYQNDIETNAAVLQAYMQINPESRLPAMLAKWLVNNQRGNIWDSTRATAMVVYSLADYARASKELAPEYTLSVDLGGRVRRSYTVTRENALFFDNQFVVPDELLETGNQTLTLSKDGPGTLYYSAFTRYFSQEEGIKRTGLDQGMSEIFVNRRYFRLVPGTASGAPQSRQRETARPNPFLTGRYELLTVGAEYVIPGDTQAGPRYQRLELKDGALLTSGDLIEVELELESKNDYDYLVFEDLKPSGCESVEVRSGGHSSGGLYSNVEFRDQKVAFFLGSLPQGKRTLSYRLRAEIPGRFHVLPTNGYAMYAPDIRAISDEMTLSVKDN